MFSPKSPKKPPKRVPESSAERIRMVDCACTPDCTCGPSECPGGGLCARDPQVGLPGGAALQKVQGWRSSEGFLGTPAEGLQGV